MKEDKKPKKKKKAGDVLLTVVLIAAICIFCYAAYNLYHIYTEYKKGSDEYNAIAQMAVTERDPDQDAQEILKKDSGRFSEAVQNTGKCGSKIEKRTDPAQNLDIASGLLTLKKEKPQLLSEEKKASGAENS